MITSDDDTDISCSDCKLELSVKVWTKFLLNWINRCVKPKFKIKVLNPVSLSEIVARYKNDICHSDFDRALIGADNIEHFIEYKYPILRLRNLCEAADYPKKQYIMTSVLLYYCCTQSTGMVEKDICKYLTSYEQELVLKFCENLSEMEITVNNVDTAITGAFDFVNKKNKIKFSNQTVFDFQVSTDSDSKLKNLTSTSKESESVTMTSEDDTVPETSSATKSALNRPPMTVLPSVVTDSSAVYTGDTSETDTLEVFSVVNVKTESESDKSNLALNEAGLECPPGDNKNLQAVQTKESRNTIMNRLRRMRGESKNRIGATQHFLIRGDCDTCVQSMPTTGPVLAKRSCPDVIREMRNRPPTIPQQCVPREMRNRPPTIPQMQMDQCPPRPPPRAVNKCDTGAPSGSEHMCRNFDCYPPCKCPISQARRPSGEPSGRIATECQTTNNYYDLKNRMRSSIKSFGRKQKPKNIKKKWKGLPRNTKKYIMIILLLLLLISLLGGLITYLVSQRKCKPKNIETTDVEEKPVMVYKYYECKNKVCRKVLVQANITDNIYNSLSICTLVCSGPQLWPYPIGYTMFSDKIVRVSSNKLEYKFQSLPSESVQQYLAEAFKLFIGDLARLETSEKKNVTADDVLTKKLHIQLDVESDPDPRLKINTEESYYLKVDTINDRVSVKLSSASFCGVRHGLQTLSQMIIFDQSSNKLITLTNAIIKDAPSYRYRGLMIDTGRNYVPVPDLMRTIDAMAMVKLNTFHWRISDVTSFPMYLPNLPNLFEYGGYDRSMIYMKDDILSIVRRARIRGIRVLLEVAAPGPVGRAWSWHHDATCPQKNENYSCKHVLCTRLHLSKSILNILQEIYSEILEMTNVDDIFHLSDGSFTVGDCYYLLEDRQGYLEKALERLKLANNGFLPKIPIIWYTKHLNQDYEAKIWVQNGVQLDTIPVEPMEGALINYRAIHSGKWDLSCEFNKLRCTKYRTWQEMYSWKSWRNLESFSIEGGEAVLWTDAINSGNIDAHLWPRAAAVAERLWSDVIANISITSNVYERLDSQRWRMLLRGINVQAIWPLWCSFNPGLCLQKIH